MRRNQLVAFLALILIVLVVGCGGGYNPPPVVPPPQSSAVSLTMRDAPPSGISILSFQVLVTGAALNPGNIDLLAGRGPVKIEVKRLEIETAFLSTATVATGTYTSVNLIFGNPELTFKNDSGTAMSVFGVNCQMARCY